MSVFIARQYWAVSIVYLDFGKAYNTVSPKILKEANEVWTGWAVNEVDWKLAEWLSPELDDVQLKI